MQREPPGQSGVAASTAMPVIGREMVQVLQAQPRRDAVDDLGATPGVVGRRVFRTSVS
jgi:hypothetical protein